MIKSKFPYHLIVKPWWNKRHLKKYYKRRETYLAKTLANEIRRMIDEEILEELRNLPV